MLLCTTQSITDFQHKNEVENWTDWQSLIHIALIQKFQWSNLIIVNDEKKITNEKILKQFSINFIPVIITSVKKSVSSNLDNFNTVLMFTKNNTNSEPMLEFIRKKIDSRFPPTNWIFITQNTRLQFQPFFIPQNVKIYLIETHMSEKEWHIYNLYFATGNKLIKKHVGVGNTESNSLAIKISTQPFPKLIGKHFRITTILQMTQLYQQKNYGKPRGFYNEITAILQKVINFTFNVEEPFDRLFGGVYRNKTSYGMLAKLYKNESDIGIALLHTKNRAKLVDFSPHIYEMKMRIIYRQVKGVVPKIFFYLQPFSTIIWTFITCLIILLAVLLTINKYFYFRMNMTKRKRRCRPKSSLLKSMTDYVTSTFYTLLLAGVPVIVFNSSSNIILQIFHLFSILIFTNYSSKLTSILTISKTHVPFESLEELVFNTNYAICTLSGTPTIEILRTSNLDLFSLTWEKIQKNPDKYVAKSHNIALQLVYTEKAAYLIDELSGILHMKGNCSYRFAKVSLFKANLGFTYRKEFIYKRMFNKYILLLRESGVLKKLRKDFLPEIHNEACKEENSIVALNMSIIMGLFLTLLGGIIISLLVFTIEKFLVLRRTKPQIGDESVHTAKLDGAEIKVGDEGGCIELQSCFKCKRRERRE
uniref:Ionotropic glutamate receptor C-terminal domain-containing protein n=1 Tax=Strigamia maritima TaxID=126957 RepID=T1JP20_STRMM